MQISPGHNASWEEGDWTPTLSAETPGDLAYEFNTDFSSYVRVEELVIVQFLLETSAWTYTTASGALLIGGLPYTNGGREASGACHVAGWVKAGVNGLSLWLDASSAVARIRASGTGAAVADLAVTEFASGGNVNVGGTLVYHGI